MAVLDQMEPVPQHRTVKTPKFTASTYHALAEKLGYEFKDRSLLKMALTHASRSKASKDYERLEFLGDRVLGLVIAEELYLRNPGQREGHMAPHFSALVSGAVCAEVARKIGLDAFIIAGQREMSAGIAKNTTVLGDSMEALVAAVYLDGGLEAARRFVLRLWDKLLSQRGRMKKDAKTFLQEWALSKSLPIPSYVVAGREGPDHAPQFVIDVHVQGYLPARGSGLSKRTAEQIAAEAFLLRENLRT
jgi:ribonuclease-3